MPNNYRIYHITQVDNLPNIIRADMIWSDRRVQEQSLNKTVIGLDGLKQRRLNEIEVSCHPGTNVGDYVPFYFCPRSVMLFVIHKRNAELAYQGGQSRIIHLVSSVNSAIKSSGDKKWAFTDGNAGAYSIRGRFRSDLNQIDSFVDWESIRKNDWRDPVAKERKQAEFLVHEFVPWCAIEGIGVLNSSIAIEVDQILSTATHRPTVKVKPDWYY